MIAVDQSLKSRPRLRLPSFLGEVLRTLLFVLTVAVLFDMAIPRSLVDGASMLPTFVDGDRLMVSRLHYLVQTPARGDVIVFNSMDPNEAGIMLIKRVIGRPGDVVEIRNNEVYVNDTLLDEPYLREPCRCSRWEGQRWELAPDQYFVMGDNRNSSRDSRYFDPVTFNHVVGKVLFRYWPLQQIGIVQGYSNVAP